MKTTTWQHEMDQGKDLLQQEAEVEVVKYESGYGKRKCPAIKLGIIHPNHYQVRLLGRVYP